MNTHTSATQCDKQYGQEINSYNHPIHLPSTVSGLDLLKKKSLKDSKNLALAMVKEINPLAIPRAKSVVSVSWGILD